MNPHIPRRRLATVRMGLAAGLAALTDIRALMTRQPGYLSEEFLQNLNADNAPRYLHVSRWASMAYSAE